MRIGDATLHTGDALEVLRTMPDESVHTCITSPPYYGLRDYGVEGQIGLEPDLEAWLALMVTIFAEVRRVLAETGTLWVNIGDNYRADKSMACQPWLFALALRDDGWILRQEIIWSKPAPMPESAKDRFTKSHEYLLLFAKSRRYYFDQEAVKEPTTGNAHARGNGVNPKAKAVSGWASGPGSHKTVEHNKPRGGDKDKGRAKQGLCTSTKFGRGAGWRNRQNPSFSAAVNEVVDTRNRRTVWTIPAAPFPGAHFATFPPDLIRPCVLAGAPPGGVVLDPFSGSGTTGMVALQEGRKYIGIELNPEYQQLAVERITPAAKQPRMFA